MATVRPVPVSSVKIIDGWNIRDNTDDVSSLANSILQNGQINPILVNEKMELIAGHRRLAAVQSLGKKEILAQVVRGVDKSIQRLAHLDENLERRDLSIAQRDKAMAERHALHRELMKAGVKKGGFQEEMEKTTGLSKTAIFRGIRRHNESSEKVWDAFCEGDIAPQQIDEMVRLPKKLQNRHIDRVKKLTPQETGAYVNNVLARANRVPEDLSVIHPKMGTIHCNKWQRHARSEVARATETLQAGIDSDVLEKLNDDQYEAIKRDVFDLREQVERYIDEF